MTRLRIFAASIVAACGIFTMVGVQSAGAIRVNVTLLEGPAPPIAPPAPGELLSLCIQIRPNPANCISI